MKVGDRFEKDGKLIEVTSISETGYGYKRVKEEAKPIQVVEEKEIPAIRRRATSRKKV